MADLKLCRSVLFALVIVCFLRSKPFLHRTVHWAKVPNFRSLHWLRHIPTRLHYFWCPIFMYAYHNINLPLRQCIIHDATLVCVNVCVCSCEQVHACVPVLHRYNIKFKVFHFLLLYAPECTIMLSKHQNIATTCSHFDPLLHRKILQCRQRSVPFQHFYFFGFLFLFFFRFFLCLLIISFYAMENDIYLFIYFQMSKEIKAKNHLNQPKCSTHNPIAIQETCCVFFFRCSNIRFLCRFVVFRLCLEFDLNRNLKCPNCFSYALLERYCFTIILWKQYGIYALSESLNNQLTNQRMNERKRKPDRVTDVKWFMFLDGARKIHWTIVAMEYKLNIFVLCAILFHFFAFAFVIVFIVWIWNMDIL